MARTGGPGRDGGRVRAAVALLLAAAALSGAAAAEPRKQEPKEADLGTKRSVAPDASLGGSLEAKKPAAAAVGPGLEFETFRRGVEVDISAKRREEIASLQKLIKLGGGSDEETPGWYFRLAELLWEESQYYFFEANRRDDRLIELGTRGDPREIDRLTAEKKALEAQQNDLQGQAVALYKAIIQRYPKYPRLDEVLYFLAQNLQKRDRKDPEALKAYRALIQHYPQSRFVPDSWMAFGEYYFDRANTVDRNENLRRALESYKHAAEYQESSVYGYALYKQGWVHYNLGNWNEALELFRAVIFFGEMPTTTVAQDRKLALVKEARKDYVRTYSHVGSAERAQEEFRRVGGEAGWWDMLKTLAGLYFDEGKDRDAVLVYSRLIKERPLGVEAPFFQSHIITCAGRLGRKDAAVQQAHVFAKMLRDIEASSEGKDPKNAKVLADARADAERTLRILAVQYHNEWKKTRDEPVAGWAADVYRDYLDIFPAEPPAYEMRFFHAELLYALASFEEAGAEYERVARADIQAVDKQDKPGKFFKDALENAVFSYDLVAKKLDETQKVAPGDPSKRIPMAPARQRLVEACERYIKYQPRGDKWVEMAYKAANLHYRHNEFGEASDLFTRIALDHPTHELAGYSANLVLDAYNLLGDWRNVNGWAKRFYANKALLEAHPQLKEDLSRVIEQSAFKVIEERERAKDWDGATDEYLAFARDWPASKLASTALYNASVDQVRAGRLDRGMEIRDQFLQRYPADPLAPKCLYDNAEAYEAIGDFGEAADRYERYFAGWRRASQPEGKPAAAPAPKAKGKKGKPPPPPVAAKPEEPAERPVYEERKANDAIINAAVFRAGLKDLARAEADSQAYLDAWPDGPDASRLFLSLADLHARRGQPQKELAQLEEYQKRYAKDPDEWLAIQERMARIYEKQGNGAMARHAYEVGLVYSRQHPGGAKDRGLSLVAQAELMALEPEFASYDRITLNVTPKYLKAQLQIKAKRLAQLEAEYGNIVKLKQAEPAICALHHIGLGYSRFAQALYDNPLPKEVKALGKEGVEEYKAQLSQVAEPLEKKAVEGYRMAVNAARDYGVTNACSKEADQALRKAKAEGEEEAVEILPQLAGAPLPSPPVGYGLLGEVQPPAAPRPAAARDEAEVLPALKVRPTTQKPQESSATNDPQRRALDADQPLPAKKRKGTEDEDLLP
ncbi:MAG TPA: tetratricopeptide repeat protein [Anaeromyxobacter sp.]|nr:tetratricopeptide repeat protein [Anaeromyxobacter sp.]